jgi:hypothetical protein
MSKVEAEEGSTWSSVKQQYTDAIAMGRTMSRNYVYWMKSLEDPDHEWKVVATEMKFRVPTPLFTLAVNPFTGERDVPVYFEGRLDQVIENTNTGSIWIREFKTASRQPNDVWLANDEQNAMYAWAVQEILGRKVMGVQYRFLLKKVPEVPGTLKNGKFSRAINSQLSTTYDVYLDTLDKRAWQVAASCSMKPLNDPATIEVHDKTLAELKAEYADILKELKIRGWSEYFMEIPVQRSSTDLQLTANELAETAREMLDPNVAIYRSPDWLKCEWCQFKEPCRIRSNGGNYEQYLAHTYRVRRSTDEYNEVEEE